jgi:hypothetical protein
MKTSIEIILKVMKKLKKIKQDSSSLKRRKKINKTINKYLGNRLHNCKCCEDIKK